MSNKTSANEQLKLVKLSDEQIRERQIELATFIVEYIRLEAEKKTMEDVFNARLNGIWAEIVSREAEIRGA